MASSWGSNPYTRGALNCATGGSAPARFTLATPVNNQVWFAGDALSVNSHSQAHGAWQTGIVAAYGALGTIGATGKARTLRT